MKFQILTEQQAYRIISAYCLFSSLPRQHWAFRFVVQCLVYLSPVRLLGFPFQKDAGFTLHELP